MPELPEVETVVRGLRAGVTGRRISRVAHVSQHLLQRDPGLRSIAGDRFQHFDRRGKFIIGRMESGRNLLIHLRMSGRLLLRPKRERRDKHDHLVLTLDGGDRKLVFRDVRKFGLVEFCNGDADSRLSSLGPEATGITTGQLRQLLQGSRRPIKAFLLDQTKVAGLGNIYVDESLYRAGVNPAELTTNLSPEQVRKLARAIRDILKKAIKLMGTTFDSYRATDGEPGRFASYLKVYHKEGNRCSICSETITKTRLAGRGTHFCPNCQKLVDNQKHEVGK